ncbi:hypothetical protein [aff. Roholtiella sp. LEGE 12411]|nr:hypothetical protein [aff. Roholtiella sp. LEGE 12411]
MNKTRISAVTRSLKDVRLIWRYFDKQGSPQEQEQQQRIVP